MVQDEREQFGTIRKEFGYREVLLRHLDRLNQIALTVYNPTPSRKNMRPYVQGVIAFETMLHPYFDAIYRRERDRIDTRHGANEVYLTDNYTKIYGKYQSVLALLMDNMGRKGLLLEEFGAEPYR